MPLGVVYMRDFITGRVLSRCLVIWLELFACSLNKIISSRMNSEQFRRGTKIKIGHYTVTCSWSPVIMEKQIWHPFVLNSLGYKNCR